MRLLRLLALTFLLLATACGEDSLPPPEPPPGAVPEATPRSIPAPLRESDPNVAPPAAPAPAEGAAPSEPTVREPPEWRDLEESLREEPDPADLVIRKDLDTTRIFVDFDGVSIAETAARLGVAAGVAVEVQVGCYEEYTAEELTVTVEPETLSVAAALDRVCAAEWPRLVWWVEAGAVKIAPRRPRPEYVSLLIPLGRLARPRGDAGAEGTRGHEPDAIADLVRETIGVAVWDEGGEVRIDWPRGSRSVNLFVKAPRATVRKILALLRELHERMD